MRQRSSVRQRAHSDARRSVLLPPHHRARLPFIRTTRQFAREAVLDLQILCRLGKCRGLAVVALAILLSALIVSYSLHRLAKALESSSDEATNAIRMLWGVFAVQLRVELEELGYEIPEWLIWDEEDEGDEPNAQIINLKLVKRPEPKEDS